MWTYRKTLLIPQNDKIKNEKVLYWVGRQREIELIIKYTRSQILDTICHDKCITLEYIIEGKIKGKMWMM